jgi:hypothetical protein
MLRFVFLLALLARCLAQSACDGWNNCNDCVAASYNNTTGEICYWSQPPSSTTATSGATCVNQSTFEALTSTNTNNAGYNYCPPSAQECDGLALAACFAQSSCDWYAPSAEIDANSPSICNSGFCVYRPPSSSLVKPVLPPFNQKAVAPGYTISCTTVATGLSPAAVGLIVAAVIIFVVIVPAILCIRFGIFTKRKNLVAGEPSRTPRRGK